MLFSSAKKRKTPWFKISLYGLAAVGIGGIVSSAKNAVRTVKDTAVSLFSKMKNAVGSMMNKEG